MFWKNFVALCNAQNKSPTTVIKDIGIAHGCVTKWKKRETNPTDKNIAKLAEYFGVQDFYFCNENVFYTMKPEFHNEIKKACTKAGITLSTLAQELGVSQNFLEWINIGIMPSYELMWGIGNHLGTKYRISFDAESFILQQGIIEKKSTAKNDDGLSDNMKKLIEFAKTVPDDKVELILKVMKSIVEAD